MDETFSFHAPAEVLRRRADPRMVRLAVFALLVAVAFGAFVRLVVESEQAGDRRMLAAERALAAPSPVVVDLPPAPDDTDAQDAVAAAMTVAREVLARTGAFVAAGTAQLAMEQPGVTYVDGPSIAPTVVSVVTTSRAWAGAAQGPSGACYWVTTNVDGIIRYGTGRVCTADAALKADALTW